MKLIGHRFWDNIWLGRAMMFLLGFSLLGAGLRAFSRDRLFYANYWGGAVFAPVSIVLGAAILVLLVVKWNTLTAKGPVLKGKAVHKAEKASRYRSTIDDYNKPWNG